MTFSMQDAEELVALLDAEGDLNEDTGDLIAGDVSWKTVRKMMALKSEKTEEWEGIPVPLPGMSMRLRKGHPYAEHQRVFEEILAPPSERRCSDDDVREEEAVIVNEWYSARIGKQVIIARHPDGRIENVSYWKSPDRSMERLNLWLQTIGASDAWDWDAERKAKRKLKDMVSMRQYRHYDLTGSFFETSPRSHLTYVFRRLRPTIVMSPRNPRGDSLLCIAVLCMHPIGYYENSWGGCMVPTDDVIAHLSFMRGDEARYWGVANKHKASAPEAGI